MRQAGRYMKEYRDVREKVGFLELCKTPELAAEVTVTAVDRIGADAAIIFADILLITEPMGFDLEFVKSGGPVIHNPFRTRKDLDRLRSFSAKEQLHFVFDALRIARRELRVPLIGFAGAPFTVASYVIEGGGSKSFEKTKTLMRSEPEAWHLLLGRIADATAEYLIAQIAAGADAVQLFDSWAGKLTVEEYEAYVLPHTRKVFAALPKETPTIHFGANTGHLLEKMKEAGGSVIGVSDDIPLDQAWKRLGDVAVQGNLASAVLLEPWETIEQETRKILDQAAGRAGHIFNLGHGILPATPVDNVRRLIDYVHAQSAR